MKIKFKATAKDQATTTITVEYTSPPGRLIREEVQNRRDTLKNQVHGLLRDRGYHVSHIKFSK